MYTTQASIRDRERKNYRPKKHQQENSQNQSESFRVRYRCSSETSVRRCKECRTWMTRSKLTRHLRRHVHALPFSCKICGLRFDDVARTRRHAQSHEKLCSIKTRSWTCPCCDWRAARVPCLRRHLTRSHPDMDAHEIICELQRDKAKSKLWMTSSKNALYVYDAGLDISISVRREREFEGSDQRWINLVSMVSTCSKICLKITKGLILT